jgi:hypothetical protein
MRIKDLKAFDEDSKRNNRAYKLHSKPIDLRLFVPYLEVKKYERRAKEWDTHQNGLLGNK